MNEGHTEGITKLYNPDVKYITHEEKQYYNNTCATHSYNIVIFILDMFFLFMSLGKFSYFLLCKVERHLQTLYLPFCTAGNGDWWVNGTVYFDVGRNVTGASRTVRGELVVGVSESQVHPMVEITSDKPYAHFGVMVSQVRSIPSILCQG